MNESNLGKVNKNSQNQNKKKADVQMANIFGQTNKFSPKRITIAVWLLGTFFPCRCVWLLVTRLFLVKLFFCHVVLSHLPLLTWDIRSGSRSYSIIVTEPLFLDGNMFCWFCIYNLMFVSMLASSDFDEIEHEGLFCEIPAPFCRA